MFWDTGRTLGDFVVTMETGPFDWLAVLEEEWCDLSREAPGFSPGFGLARPPSACVGVVVFTLVSSHSPKNRHIRRIRFSSFPCPGCCWCIQSACWAAQLFVMLSLADCSKAVIITPYYPYKNNSFHFLFVLIWMKKWAKRTSVKGKAKTKWLD